MKEPPPEPAGPLPSSYPAVFYVCAAWLGLGVYAVLLLVLKTFS